MKTKNDFYVYINSSFQIFRVGFWSLFNFQNKFIKQFAMGKDRFLNFGEKIFWKKEVICVNRHEYIQVGNFCFIEIQSYQTSCFYFVFSICKAHI